MELNIIVKNHRDAESTREFMRDEISQNFSKYSFITKCKATSTKLSNGDFEIQIEVSVKNGSPLFASSEGQLESRVLNTVINKINRQASKYKDRNYHSSSRKIAPN